MVLTNAWLTKRGDNVYMITKLPPTICRVYGTKDRFDAYITPGDSIGLNNLCSMALRYNDGKDILILQSVRIKF